MHGDIVSNTSHYTVICRIARRCHCLKDVVIHGDITLSLRLRSACARLRFVPVKTSMTGGDAPTSFSFFGSASVLQVVCLTRGVRECTMDFAAPQLRPKYNIVSRGCVHIADMAHLHVARGAAVTEPRRTRQARRPRCCAGREWYTSRARSHID